MSSEFLESKRRKKRLKPFNVVALDKDRQELEERRIREAYDRTKFSRYYLIEECNSFMDELDHGDCPYCLGLGDIGPNEGVTCPVCDGTGKAY